MTIKIYLVNIFKINIEFSYIFVFLWFGASKPKGKDLFLIKYCQMLLAPKLNKDTQPDRHTDLPTNIFIYQTTDLN